MAMKATNMIISYVNIALAKERKINDLAERHGKLCEAYGTLTDIRVNSPVINGTDYWEELLGLQSSLDKMLSENTEELVKAKDDFEAHMQSCSDASGTKQYEFSNGVKVFVKKPS